MGSIPGDVTRTVISVVPSKPKTCQFCNLNKPLHRHHQYPKQYRQRSNYVEDIAWIDVYCERFMHGFFSNKLLEKLYFNVVRVDDLIDSP